VVRQIVAGSPEPVRLGGIAAVVGRALEQLLPSEVRYVALGHVQRGGAPTAADRVLATRFGTAAVDAVDDSAWGSMVALRGDRVERVPITQAIARPRLVDPQGERVRAARAVRTTFGDEPA